MSSPISQIVDVNISQTTQAVQQASFSIPAIFGPSNRQDELIAYYTSLSGMVAEGYLTSDPEYIRAQKLLSQELQPELFAVGKYTEAVIQQDTFAVNSLDTANLYNFSLNGTPINYQAVGGNTQQVILSGLNSAISTAFPSNPPVSGNVTGTGGSALLTLVSLVAGQGVSYTAIDSLLTHVETVENHSIVEDIQAAQEVSDTWYGLTICSQEQSDIEQVAAYIETQLKIFIADTDDADILTSATDDVASELQDAGYKRTASLYTGESNNGAAAAWLGGQLPQVPGASTWKFKQLVGIDPDTLTANERLICIGVKGSGGKNCNIYETVGGVNITEEGFMAGGQFIDLTVGIDWLTSRMQENVYAVLIGSPKIPYTNAGIATVEAAVRQTLLQGVANGLIDGSSALEVNAPNVADIPVADRQGRVLPDVTFSCRLAGALHFVEINGVVSV